MNRRDFFKGALGLAALAVVPKPFKALANDIALPDEEQGRAVLIRITEAGKTRRDVRFAFKKDARWWLPSDCMKAIHSFLRVNGVTDDYFIEVYL